MTTIFIMDSLKQHFGNNFIHSTDQNMRHQQPITIIYTQYCVSVKNYMSHTLFSHRVVFRIG